MARLDSLLRRKEDKEGVISLIKRKRERRGSSLGGKCLQKGLTTQLIQRVQAALLKEDMPSDEIPSPPRS